MSKLFLSLLFSLLTFYSFSQPQKGTNTIIIHKVGFIEMCTALLDAGFIIAKKDNDLQTINTEYKTYPKMWDGAYSMYVRIKDSTAFITGKFNAPSDGKGLFKDEEISCTMNKKGELTTTIMGYGFIQINNFAIGLKKEISYLKK